MLWDAAAFGLPVQRKRFFFRNFHDREECLLQVAPFEPGWGPFKKNGQIAPLSPLLRTRIELLHGMLRSSWTLYQPRAMLWRYDFWGGVSSFKEVHLQNQKLPTVKWEVVVPPPFFAAWLDFLTMLSRDGVIIPLFTCETHWLPVRILTPTECLRLRG